MLMEERENSESIQHTGLQPKSSDCKVSLKEVNASWDKVHIAVIGPLINVKPSNYLLSKYVCVKK